ncbi:AMSH-like ubiquitin thioesterase 1 isoform X2 [Aristolochia californica]|uniref:AMSH-like ubiquitin thioesterase 1 isoform X2 n=1 Tax=Aristolochia californica TaxID=171875 RepID=UPI0035DF773B
MRSSSRPINTSAYAPRLDVDNRISLRYYYRIADNLLKQAEIYHAEKNIIDLYTMLLRFSSLITETIPSHQDYQVSLQRERQSFKKKLLNALNELEALKPAFLSHVEELNRKHLNEPNSWEQGGRNFSSNSSLEWPSTKRQNSTHRETRLVTRFVGPDSSTQDSLVNRNSFSSCKGSRDRFLRFPLNIPRPKEETLSKHSILGPNGLQGQWQPPTIDRGVRYPSNLDLSPVEIPSLLQPVENGALSEKDCVKSDPEKSTLEAVFSLDDGRWTSPAEEPCSLTSSNTIEASPRTDIIRQPSPPPVLADVQDLILSPSLQPLDLNHEPVKLLEDQLVQSESPLQLLISTQMMDTFMRLAKSNTDRNLETCGVLAGSLKNRKFYITALIIPKQESTSDSCQTTNEEEIFDVQDKQSLFPLGWIHTHPTQSCFMSSVDLHTHYSYQIMLPEAIAIVMAPSDSSRTHGIFRLTKPGGMSVIRQCQHRGFHPHDQPPNGGPIYDHCTDVYVVPNQRFDVIDLR